MTGRDLRVDVRVYVEMGGRDAFSFAVSHKPFHGDIPGRDLQRIIDDEVERQYGEAE